MPLRKKVEQCARVRLVFHRRFASRAGEVVVRAILRVPRSRSTS